MSEPLSQQDISEIRDWQQKIAIANRNNIFCHCRTCGYEWVDSTFDAICPTCASKKVGKETGFLGKIFGKESRDNEETRFLASAVPR